jgi:hypothetical protein
MVLGCGAGLAGITLFGQLQKVQLRSEGGGQKYYIDKTDPKNDEDFAKVLLKLGSVASVAHQNSEFN